MKVSWLVDTKNRMQRALDSAAAQVDREAKDVKAVADTPGLDPDFKRQRLEQIRAPYVDAVAALVGDSDAMLALVKAQKPHWNSKEWLLTRAAFSTDPVADAQIKSQKQAEFAAMNPATLQLVADAAVADGDLATLGVAVNVSGGYSGQPGWRGVDLSRIDFPEQAAALSAIAACESLSVLIHQQWVLARGQAMTPASKLTAARAQVALEQTRRTTAPSSALHT